MWTFTFTQIATDKTGTEIQEEFFRYVVPNIREFGEAGMKTRIKLNVTCRLTMMAIFHAMDGTTFKDVNRVIERLLRKEILCSSKGPVWVWVNLFLTQVLHRDFRYFAANEMLFKLFKDNLFLNHLLSPHLL